VGVDRSEKLGNVSASTVEGNFTKAVERGSQRLLVAALRQQFEKRGPRPIEAKEFALGYIEDDGSVVVNGRADTLREVQHGIPLCFFAGRGCSLLHARFESHG
jgi:hypothetical protein